MRSAACYNHALMSTRIARAAAPWLTTLFLAAIFFVACGGSGDDPVAVERTTTAPPSQTTVTTAVPEDLVMAADDFTNINAMTPVDGYFIDNRLGHLDEALAVARSETGGSFPVGTVIQLVPQEAMVKRHAGWSPKTNDWEFFFLEVSVDGTVIATRGADDVVNQFGLNCAACHVAADPAFDFVCGADHGCAPLPIGDDIIAAVQAADPRPRT